MTGLLLAAGFAVILVGAVLFTNAVEWLAHRLELGSGAAGSVLAAVAIALPESTILIVAIIGGAEGSEDVAIGAIVGAPFMLATIATELPEKANSIIWLREGKDTLALGNINGAMVFQSTIPIAFGLAFTSWHLDWRALLAAGLALAGGTVAVWALHVRCRFSLLAILLWVAVFATAVAAT
jgi:cation:H+ antiporter